MAPVVEDGSETACAWIVYGDDEEAAALRVRWAETERAGDKEEAAAAAAGEGMGGGLAQRTGFRGVVWSCVTDEDAADAGAFKAAVFECLLAPVGLVLRCFGSGEPLVVVCLAAAAVPLAVLVWRALRAGGDDCDRLGLSDVLPGGEAGALDAVAALFAADDDDDADDGFWPAPVGAGNDCDDKDEGGAATAAGARVSVRAGDASLRAAIKAAAAARSCSARTVCA